MTTVTTVTASTTLDEKHPAVYHKEVLIEQRERNHVSSRVTHQTETPVQQATRLSQRALLLHAAQQPYTLVTDHAIPSISHEDEILIKVPSLVKHPQGSVLS